MTTAAYPVSAALTVNNLDAFYGKCQVTFDAQLHVGRGEIVALLGRNGAGKTTTLMAIAGFVTARRGKVLLAGNEIATAPAFRRVRAGLSLVPSGSRSLGSLTVLENLQTSAGVSARNGQWSIDKVFGLFPKLRQLAGSQGRQLSGGERQMLAVGRALLSQPEVLMLDEPSEGLAPLVVAELGGMLRRLADAGLAVLLTEQNHGLALDIADRVLFMEKGQIAWEGSASEAKDPEVLGRYLSV
ncbi:MULTISPECIES: ABC transporter ATP-binding protein [Aminobacter]|jgi:branched-chain amino acid transport system ATP-binding protein|uniref:Branched-chain amino acid transport system ATP-binding protein n=1 Tax=Aminobacter ciceronei TaxID=150723 RepID=A0ABR6CHD9_9HYPH|nr:MULTISPECIES: ABC transporter ATP-binding protein [Aminobacter]MBA8910569.1 branched-chain amino acid transport system ATP-binding protein [Aminobacter ciceronei]MBA9024341.1 branched-chain amino acid transport system ATP-binding protein [Aminobacter ciceronei]MCX8571052.1 ABC transporter ATP-binding protein [Aminobacter sp. MET-1]QOF70807.1 ABC transporter ATP-binding protein [Aminobacter sp. SR38]